MKYNEKKNHISSFWLKRIMLQFNGWFERGNHIYIHSIDFQTVIRTVDCDYRRWHVVVSSICSPSSLCYCYPFIWNNPTSICKGLVVNNSSNYEYSDKKTMLLMISSFYQICIFYYVVSYNILTIYWKWPDWVGVGVCLEITQT